MRRAEGIGMKRVALVGLVLLGLASCRRTPEEAPAAPIDGNEGAAAEAVTNLPEPDINASLETIGAMHPDEADYRFAGRWAVDQRLCENQSWRFTNTELRTPAGSICRFSGVRAVPGGYDVTARCTGEGGEREDRLRLRFAESADSMLVESDTVASAGLMPCGG